MLLHDREDLESRHQAVACGGVVGKDQVSRLFSTKDGTEIAHGLADVAIADRGTDEADLVGVEGVIQAEIAHDRGDDGVMRQASARSESGGADREDLVAVKDLAFLIDEEEAIGVSIEGDTYVGFGVEDGALEGFRMERARAFVDIATIGGDALGEDGGTEAPEDLWAEVEGGTVCGIDEQGFSAQGEVGRPGAEEMGEVGFRSCGIGIKPPDPRGIRPREEAIEGLLKKGFNGGFGVVGEFVAVGVKEFDPIVLERIVRGGDHDAKIGFVERKERGDGRSREDAEGKEIGPHRGGSGREGGFEDRAGKPRVTSEEDSRRAIVGVSEEGNDSGSDGVSDLGGHRGKIDLPANSVGTKETSWRSGHAKLIEEDVPKRTVVGREKGDQRRGGGRRRSGGEGRAEGEGSFLVRFFRRPLGGF